jgi:hypothetical protein
MVRTEEVREAVSNETRLHVITPLTERTTGAIKVTRSSFLSLPDIPLFDIALLTCRYLGGKMAGAIDDLRQTPDFAFHADLNTRKTIALL